MKFLSLCSVWILRKLQMFGAWWHDMKIYTTGIIINHFSRRLKWSVDNCLGLTIRSSNNVFDLSVDFSILGSHNKSQQVLSFHLCHWSYYMLWGNMSKRPVKCVKNIKRVPMMCEEYVIFYYISLLYRKIIIYLNKFSVFNGVIEAITWCGLTFPKGL